MRAKPGTGYRLCPDKACVFVCVVPLAAPRNLTFDLLEQQLSLNWAKLQEDELQGKLLAYKVQWTLGGEPQVRRPGDPLFNPLVVGQVMSGDPSPQDEPGLGNRVPLRVQISLTTIVMCYITVIRVSYFPVFRSRYCLRRTQLSFQEQDVSLTPHSRCQPAPQWAVDPGAPLCWCCPPQVENTSSQNIIRFMVPQSPNCLCIIE